MDHQLDVHKTGYSRIPLTQMPISCAAEVHTVLPNLIGLGSSQVSTGLQEGDSQPLLKQHCLLSANSLFPYLVGNNSSGSKGHLKDQVVAIS